MTNFIFNTTPSIRQSWGTAGKLASVLSDLPLPSNNKKILFVTDLGIIKLGLANEAMVDLKKNGYDLVLFDQVEPDPMSSTVLGAVKIAKQENCSCVVGFGGGSSMDVAKMIALLAKSDQPLDEMYGVNQVVGKRLPLVLIPTTAGTGSEVTAVSILTTGTEEKKGVVSPVILPDIAVLDAELTLGLPSHITAATGVDAMVHAIEAYTSKSINNNPISRMLAKQALDLLGANIHEAVSNGINRSAREAMLLGSMLAGQAFANSPVAAVHALAYPVGSLFHVPHGLSNALVLKEVMRFNAPDCALEYSQLAPHVFSNIDTSKTAHDIADDFIEKLGKLNVDLGLKSGLKHVGISQSDIPRLATDAMKQTRLLVNNPRELSKTDVEQIYSASL